MKRTRQKSHHALPISQAIWNLVAWVGCFILLVACGSREPDDQPVRLAGEAQGTTWHIAYYDQKKVSYQDEIDSILRKIDTSLSTYLPVSIVSRINQNDSSAIPDDYFREVFLKSLEVSQKTGGAFDITVAPLVNAWGFGFSKKERVDSAMIQNLLPAVGYQKVKLENGRLVKQNPSLMLDFNAIAQGYSVDLIGSFLESKGIGEYFVELGGEVRASGRKPGGKQWTVGIDQPSDSLGDAHKLEAILHLQDRGMATSGNYRKFYVEDGIKRSHILDPATGFPAGNNLLSATVIAPDCMTADAYATAFMVMGLDRSRAFLAANRDLALEVFFVYDKQGKWQTYHSESLDNSIVTEPE